MNKKKICTTCGTQFPFNDNMPALCPICDDDRQFVPDSGQGWTDLGELSGHYSIITRKLNEHLYELKMTPSFALAQRALLVLSPGGNILWDCLSLLNEPTIEFIRAKGGLKAIAVSHPHYYTSMNEWAEVFDCPIYIHRSDGQWIMNKGSHVNLWDGTAKELWDGVKLINIGGHFPGSSILQAPFLSPGGAVLTGDTIYVAPSRRHMAAMYSFPNRIPLPVQEIQRIKQQMMGIPFDAMYGSYDFANIPSGAKAMLESSLGKYV